MPLFQQRRLPPELQMLHVWAAAGTSAQAIAAEQARKRALAEHFNPEMPREDRKLPHPLLTRLAEAQRQRREVQNMAQPRQTSVRRMARILEALDRNRGRPLGEIFRRREKVN